LEYLDNPTDVNQVHSLNIDSSKAFLFEDIFEANEEKRFSSLFVDQRPTYYEAVAELAANKDGIFYVVGSDEFLKENIKLLLDKGIQQEQIMLDKRVDQLPAFFPTTETTA